MHIFHRNFFLFLFLLIFNSNSINTATSHLFNKKRILSTKQTDVPLAEKPIIIFDLINVLFKESYTGFAQKIGYATLANYAITHWKNPGHRCLDMLHMISTTDDQKPHVCIVLHGKTMPRCIVELHEGKKTCQETNNEIQKAIELLDQKKFFTSIKEKKLMLTIMNLMLDPNAISHITEPIKQMITLAQKLKNNGYSLYLFANVPHEFFSALQNKYPSILSLFDGVVVSAQTQMVKPNKEMFEYLLTTHKLTPQHCILIDNFKENIAIAQSCGMQGMVYEKPSGVIHYLKERGVIFH